MTDLVISKYKKAHIYGRLYNWHAVDDARGLAPDGWHVPTYAECTALDNYLITNGYNYDNTTSGNKVAKALSTSSGWSSSGVAGAVGNADYPEKRNITGFSAKPGGHRYTNGNFYYIGMYSYWWIADGISSTDAWHRRFVYNSASTTNGGAVKRYGFSVRLIRDDLTGYVEGEKVTDLDGNVYDTVRIGDQVWMVQNWACTKYANGESIPNVTSASSWSTITTGAYCNYNNNENNALVTTQITVQPLDSSEIVQKLNGEDICKISIESTEAINFDVRDYIAVLSRNYYLNVLPKVVKTSSRKYKYECVFESIQYELGKIIYMDSVQGGEFSYTGDLDFFVTQLVANMNRIQSGWSKGTIEAGTETKSLQFSNENCLSVLQRLCDEYELTFSISESKVISVTTPTQGIPLTFEYGKGKGLYSLTRKVLDSKNIVTRVYPYGSERNIPANYRGGSPRLKLASNYLDQNTSLYGIIESVQTWDEIYPRFTGSVTSSPSNNIIVVSSLDFDINDHLVPGTSAKVHFNTGLLAGYEFEIASYNNSTKAITIINFQQEKVTNTAGELTPLILPNDTLKPTAGDAFVLLDIAMPDSYVQAAEAELNDKAVEFLAQNSIPRVGYELDIDPMYMGTYLYTIALGEYVRILDAALNIDRTVRIIGLTRNIYYPNKYKAEIGDQLEPGIINRIVGEVEDFRRLIVVNKLNDLARARRNWRAGEDLKNLVFDTDGYFDTGNIRPLSIETGMLSVGLKSQQYTLTDIEFTWNYLNSTNHTLLWTSGQLNHFTIDDDNVRNWDITAGSVACLDSTSYYVYARCARASSAAEIIATTTQYKFDDGDTYYYFLIGVFHKAVDDERVFSATYGSTQITGRTIRTGRIQSQDGLTYFDLDSGNIVGKITFQSGKTDTELISEVTSAQGEINNLAIGGANLIPNAYVNENNNNTAEFAFRTAIGYLSTLQQYTFSCKASSGEYYGTALRVFLFATDNNQITGTWVDSRYLQFEVEAPTVMSVTFTPPIPNKYYFVGAYAEVDEAPYVEWYKLEVGSKATAFSLLSVAEFDRTKTVIDGGIITSGRIELGNTGTVNAGINGGGTASTDIRIWAGATYANRATAPFRINQAGQLFATLANIQSAGSGSRFVASGNKFEIFEGSNSSNCVQLDVDGGEGRVSLSDNANALMQLTFGAINGLYFYDSAISQAFGFSFPNKTELSYPDNSKRFAQINGDAKFTKGINVKTARTGNSNYTITDNDYAVFCNNTSTITVYMPAAANRTDGRCVVIKKVSTGTVNVSGNGVVMRVATGTVSVGDTLPISSVNGWMFIYDLVLNEWEMIGNAN